jgi:hypothetical protein
LDKRLDMPQNSSGRGGEEKNFQPLLGLKPPIIQPIAQRYTTELSRLLPQQWEESSIVTIYRKVVSLRVIIIEASPSF